MTEPASTAAGGIALYKLGLLALVVALITAVVVMSMAVPKTVREWAVALISTVFSSLGGGAFLIRWFELGHWVNDYFGLVGLGAVIFACGLPGWVLVRSWFVFAEKRREASLPDIVREIKESAGL